MRHECGNKKAGHRPAFCQQTTVVSLIHRLKRNIVIHVVKAATAFLGRRLAATACCSSSSGFAHAAAATLSGTTASAEQLHAISNNLGDSKSLVTHPATTTHMRVGADERARQGITDGALRLSIGLEDPADLIHDLLTAADASQMRLAAE